MEWQGTRCALHRSKSFLNACVERVRGTDWDQEGGIITTELKEKIQIWNVYAGNEADN